MAISSGALIAASLGSALVSGGLGMAGSAMGSAMSAYQARKNAEHQAELNYQYSKKSALNTPTWNRQGLENAGFNPMLAVQNSTSGSNSSWASAQSNTAPDPDLTGAISAGIANAQSFQRLNNETNVSDSTADMNYATADKAKAEKATILQKLPFVSRREKAEIANVEKQSAKLENDIHYQNEMINYYQNSLKLQEMGLEPQIINAGANSSIAKTKALEYEINKEIQEIMRDKEKRYKEWGQKHPYLRNVDESLSRYFNGFGANASGSVSTRR